MKVRAQIGMVLNLDKCIGCHTCSVTCKNVWTSREGVEYAWFNNVETKPGIGYPKDWEDQDKWQGGWGRNKDGSIEPKQGSRWKILGRIFANPYLPQIDEYYEPWDYDYAHLQNAGPSKAMPVARPRSLISGKRMEKIEWGPNWEEILGTEFSKRSKDTNFDQVQKDIYGQFENTFMMYLPRLCEHCLNPACVASCPSGAIYKREEDGIVLIDQDKCRGWRMCVSGCPYKKIYYNWNTGKSEKCIFCYPRIEAGQPTVCSETCVGRIRYLGVLLYDADRIEQAASVADEADLYQAQLDMFLDPFDPAVQAEARKAGIPEAWLVAAQESPVYKMALDWKIAFPLHPEYRTLPMVWYVPPLSPIQAAAQAGSIGRNGLIPDVASLRIPLKYLANLLTAGREAPVKLALERMLAMRAYMRAKTVDGEKRQEVLDVVGLSEAQVESMYRYLAIANFEDRFVIPTDAPRIRDLDLRRAGRARRLRLQLRQRLLGWHQQGEPVRESTYDRAPGRPDPRGLEGIGATGGDIQGPLRPAQLSDGRPGGRRARTALRGGRDTRPAGGGGGRIAGTRRRDRAARPVRVAGGLRRPVRSRPSFVTAPVRARARRVA